MQCKEWDDANSELFKESHDEAVHKNSYKSRLYELISASLDRSHTKKTEKPIRGSIQVSSTNESGVCALALPFAWVLLRSCRQREESPASLFLIAFLSSVFLLPSVFPGFQKRKDEKWNSLMSPLSPALFSTADVEKGI